MTAGDGYRNTNRIAYLGNFPGARREKDLLAVRVKNELEAALTDDINRLVGRVAPASGYEFPIKTDSPLDVSASTVSVEGEGIFQIQEDKPLDVSASTVQTQVTNQVSINAANSLDVSAATVPVDHQGKIETETKTDYPGYTELAWPLILGSDLETDPISVGRSEEVIISIFSKDSNAWSASVDWVDDEGNVFSSETKTDLGLDSVVDEAVHLDRKGPQLELTVTDESGGNTNEVNVYIDAHE